MDRLIKYWSLFFLLGASSLGLSQGYVIDSMVVDIVLTHEGEASVTERIYVDFKEKRRGIIREIPYAYKLEDKKYNLSLESVNTANDEKRVTRKGGKLSIRIGNKKKYITGKKEYTIFYKAVGPFIKSDTYEEFYWNLTGNKWDTSIGKARFNIDLPNDVSIRYNDVRIFTGKVNSKEKNANVFSNENKVYGQTTQPLKSGEGLTVAIKLPSGFISDSNIFEKRKENNSIRDIPLWSMIIPATFLMGILGWWKGLRGSKEAYDTVPISYPPMGMSPVTVGGFIDNKVNNRDVISLIPFWANMGVLTMTRISDDDLLFERKSDLPIERPSYEHDFFDAIFEGGPYTNLSEVNTTMYKTIAKVKQEVYKELVDNELYDQRYSYWFKSWRIILLGFICLILGVAMFILSHLFTGILFLIAGFICFILRAVSAPPSEKGLALRSKLKGLESHLKSEDDSNIQNVLEEDENYYSRVFPFALALGLESSWSEKVIKYNDTAPSWYYLGNGYVGNRTKSEFSEIFQPKTIESAFIKYPQSSSSSGGFSGGSSGGGFGGGGGSSW